MGSVSNIFFTVYEKRRSGRFFAPAASDREGLATGLPMTLNPAMEERETTDEHRFGRRTQWVSPPRRRHALCICIHLCSSVVAFPLIALSYRPQTRGSAIDLAIELSGASSSSILQFNRHVAKADSKLGDGLISILGMGVSA